MIASEKIAEMPAASEPGFIGRIPVRNLWLLMLYASELFRTKGSGKIGLEDSPDELPDLIAEILAHSVEVRQRRQLSLGYQSQNAILNRVRGRIDVLKTERHQLLSRGLIACRYESLTINTPRNRYVRAALESISRLVKRPEIAHRCRTLASSMKTMGVSGEPPTRSEIGNDRFGRNDKEDRIMVNAAKLAFDLTLPNEVSGANVFLLPDREERWVRSLFENSVYGFYNVVLDSNQWRVYRNLLTWPIEKKSAGIDKILPLMRTDVVLDHSPSNRRIVIDTKFNSIVTSGWYRDETLRSGYVYQIYAYLRSQVGRGDLLADNASGLLLHPSIGEMVDEAVAIQGHTIRFATVDLTASTDEIRRQLLKYSEPAFPED